MFSYRTPRIFFHFFLLTRVPKLDKLSAYRLHYNDNFFHFSMPINPFNKAEAIQQLGLLLFHIICSVHQGAGTAVLAPR